MNVNRNYYEMQVEGHPLAPKEVDVTERQLGRFRELVFLIHLAALFRRLRTDTKTGGARGGVECSFAALCRPR